MYLHTSIFSKCLFLALEGMFWSIPDPDTNMVGETRNRALESDRTGTAITSYNLDKHLTAQNRCSEIFLNEYIKSLDFFEL